MPSLSILAAISAAALPSPSVLIFDFPDGARGRMGKIDGAVEYRRGPSEMEILRHCGLKSPTAYDKVSHHFYVFGRSTRADVKVVRCFQSRTFRHFNVGRGHLNADLGGFPSITDDKPFRQFWRQKSKSN